MATPKMPEPRPNVPPRLPRLSAQLAVLAWAIQLLWTLAMLALMWIGTGGGGLDPEALGEYDEAAFARSLGLGAVLLILPATSCLSILSLSVSAIALKMGFGARGLAFQGIVMSLALLALLLGLGTYYVLTGGGLHLPFPSV